MACHRFYNKIIKHALGFADMPIIMKPSGLCISDSRRPNGYRGNQKVKSIIVTEVTVKCPFIAYSSQNPRNFLDMEVIMIKEDDKCLSPFQLKSIRVTFLQ